MNEMISSKSLQNTINYLNASRRKREKQTEIMYQLAVEAEHVFELLFCSSTMLAVYGSLMPGKENHHVMDGIEGNWSPGTVKGYFQDNGWGAGLGYPSMVWDPEGNDILVQVLVSADLPAHWGRLDFFEGEEYNRILIPVYRGNHVQWVANIYESAIKTP